MVMQGHKEESTLGHGCWAPNLGEASFSMSSIDVATPAHIPCAPAANEVPYPVPVPSRAPHGDSLWGSPASTAPKIHRDLRQPAQLGVPHPAPASGPSSQQQRRGNTTPMAPRRLATNGRSAQRVQSNE